MVSGRVSKNAYLAKVKAQREYEIARARLFTIQQCKDMAIIAAAQTFGLGPDRVKRFSDTYDKVFTEYAIMVQEDTKDIEYSKYKVDEALKAVCGEYFAPFDERYS